MVICGTGHYPDKIGGYSEEAFRRVVETAKDYLIENKDNIELVIAGLAQGYDTALGYAAMELNMPLESVVPGEYFADYFNEIDKHRYDTLLAYSAKNGKVTMTKGCGERNEYMVDNADLTVALWNGTPGGTGWTVGYANKVGKPVHNLWPKFEEKLNAVNA